MESRCRDLENENNLSTHNDDDDVPLSGKAIFVKERKYGPHSAVGIYIEAPSLSFLLCHLQR